ncbi:hypothetical protein FA13DRAFT_337729 [Coprinellus micaceus]|uniref:Uncharacterized protein n=1 Tax=Coprinellus micaceus TaxID=71717 RepID=A0A4Y7TBV5_COPMI|nr:hypothetical protein FA13DRAFT_337729 [Coprinellus micaceus]
MYLNYCRSHKANSIPAGRRVQRHVSGFRSLPTSEGESSLKGIVPVDPGDDASDLDKDFVQITEIPYSRHNGKTYWCPFTMKNVLFFWNYKTFSEPPFLPPPSSTTFASPPLRPTSSSGFTPSKPFSMPSDGSCQRFNNACQAAYGNVAKPVVLSWETNDPASPWCAQARLLSATDPTKVIAKLGNGSASQRQQAKDQAAREAYEALCAQYPGLNL